MLSLVTVFILFLTNAFVSTHALHVNIDVHLTSKDDAVLDAIQRVASAINADNRFISADLVQHDCSQDLEECGELTDDSVFVAISSPDYINTKVDGVVKRGSVQKETQRLFIQFASKIYLHRSEERDSVQWWKYQLTAPAAKDGEQVDKLIRRSNNQITFVLYYEPGFDEARSLVIMFFASTRKSDVYKNFKQFAREHHGDYHMTELIDPAIEKWYGVDLRD
ncbi:unnamed protein product [Strongylus vulgaris]|uniref:Uncharacterized protein n=1 Tax=Strongylus vulgaris TaxID=40348 RepID=A0A3P7JKV1_STRVU|nr:unnamed protein product [Strongylus vulgaris]